AVGALADAGEQSGAVELGRVERPDESVLRGPPVEARRARGLGGEAARVAGLGEAPLGGGDLGRGRRGVFLHDRQGPDRVEYLLVLARGDRAEPELAGALQERRVLGLRDDRRVPGALVD